MNAFEAALAALERATVLDKAAATARDVVGRVLGSSRVKDALHGTWLGHPLHPALAQVALGSYLSASVIDLVGGHCRESTRLIALGVAATVPTAAAGWADFSDAHEEQQRVGLVHAALNATAATAFLGVLAARARGRRARGLSVLGGVLGATAATLGGHMSFRQALGANHAEHVPHVGPGQWRSLGPLNDLPEGKPVRRHAGDLPVVVLRTDDTARVLADTCPHLAGPMSDGELGDDGTLTCPWHGSAFRISDGHVVHGPATAPLPCFETRVTDGALHAKVREIPGVPAG